MSLNLVILFRLNSGDECSLYVALLMQRMAFFCKISSLLIYFLYEFPQSRLPYDRYGCTRLLYASPDG